MNRFVFEFVGVASALTLGLIFLLLLTRFWAGDSDVVADFFREYQGIEPFVIFIFPVVLIIGTAWLWNRFARGQIPGEKKPEQEGGAL